MDIGWKIGTCHDSSDSSDEGSMSFGPIRNICHNSYTIVGGGSNGEGYQWHVGSTGKSQVIYTLWPPLP